MTQQVATKELHRYFRHWLDSAVKPPTAKSITVNALLFGLLIAAFLIAYQPFGTFEAELVNKNIKLAGYGLMAFFSPWIAFGVCQLLSKMKIWSPRWTRLKHLSLLMLTLLASGPLSYGYYCLVIEQPFHLFGLLYFYRYVFAVGILPMFLLVSLRSASQTDEVISDTQQQEVTASQTSREGLTEEPELKLTGENNNDELFVLPTDLRYLKAADNYTEVVYQRDETNQTALIRSSLSALERQLAHTKLMRCHRSYLINPTAVTHCEGNAQGLKVTVENCSETVPVSRRYVSDVRQALRGHS